MSKISEAKSKALGSISAIQTILNNYPVIDTSLWDTENFSTSFNFTLNVLEMLGVNQNDIVKWLSNLLSQKFLDKIEFAVKTILLLNIKNLFTCSFNPIIPDNLLYGFKGKIGEYKGGEGIEIDIPSIDMFGLLNKCPTDDKYKNLYFDAKESYYSTNDKFVDGYTVNELWKSCDFDAFLWYVINKGTIVEPESYKCYWDNRVKYIEKFKKDEYGRKKFLNSSNPSNVYKDEKRKDYISITDENNKEKYKKKQILLCQYIERDTDTNSSDVLRVWLNPYRYYRTRGTEIKVKNLDGKEETIKIGINKTLFEFNYDYIYSLKLFDTKTLIASIVNAVFGFNFNIEYEKSNGLTNTSSVAQQVIAEKVKQIVENVIKNESEDIAKCYYTFSNEEYDKMLQDTISKRNGTYNLTNRITINDIDDIMNKINNINPNATPEEQVLQISETISTIGELSANIEYKDNSTINIANSQSTDTLKFSFCFSIIQKFIQETITQIVMQIMTPKVAILFKINNMIMGDIDPETALKVKFDGWPEFLNSMQNIIINTVKEIVEMLLQELIAFMMKELSKILALFVSKLALETFRDYKELIMQLLTLCGQSFNNSSNGNGGNYIMANGITDYVSSVNGDIISTKTSSVDECD